MKKVLAILLVVAMLFSFAACGKKEEPAKEPEKVQWPNGTVNLLAGYEVGSLTDVNIRTLADWLTQKYGATVEVTNDAVGGGANLAVELTKADPDGQTLMLIGMNCILNYYNGTWAVSPSNDKLFKVVASSIQPWPYSGCMVLTQGNAPYNNFDELKAYIEAHPGEVTAASIPGKVMDVKLKSFLIQTGLADKVRWVSTTSADGNTALLNGTINLVMSDEASAVTKFLPDTEHPTKCVINLRPDNDYSYYPAETKNLDMIKAQQTLEDVFGKEKAQQINVPNTSVWVVPAETPDEICDQIAAAMDAIDKETSGEFYDRCRTNGGTSKYWVLSYDEIMEEYKRIDPVIKQIVELNTK